MSAPSKLLLLPMSEHLTPLSFLGSTNSESLQNHDNIFEAFYTHPLYLGAIDFAEAYIQC